VIRGIRDETRFLNVSGLLIGLINVVMPAQGLPRLRTALLRLCGVSIGRSTVVCGAMHVTGASHHKLLEIGPSCVLSGLTIDLGGRVVIGRAVYIGARTTLLTVSHEIGPPECRCGPVRFGSITIGDGAWIAANVTVLPGVTIGAGAVVGSGAVVSRDVPPHTLVAGVPARVVRSLSNEMQDDDATGPSRISALALHVSPEVPAFPATNIWAPRRVDGDP
jgi:maltose O-acetyltransferase